MKYFFVSLLALTCTFGSAQTKIESIIPRPVEVIDEEGEMTIDALTSIHSDRVFEEQAVYLNQQIKKQVGLDLKLKTPSPVSIFLAYDTLIVNKPEMYVLNVRQKAITIIAGDAKGIVNGIQTLLQLMPLENADRITIPMVSVTDFPEFAYRGMHLDVVRHFFPVDYIKKYIDYLTFHKYNTFHWHLTDDQGWRIEMLHYKKLNETGSWREATLIGHFSDQPARYDSTRYGGYYTREEIKDIIHYASVRGINIIPEIDIPGHSRAIIASYPEFSTDANAKWNVATTWGMYNRQNNVLAPRPQTFDFLRTVFHEIADLFPSEFIHIGGDECSKMWWKADPLTQAFMKEKGLKDESELQDYFIEKVAGYLAEKNKKIIGWHEIIDGNISRSAIVMNWADDKKAIEAAKKGHAVIMSPGKPLYFNHYQSKPPHDSLAIRGNNPLEAVYNYDPVPDELVPLQLQYLIKGAQANVWTEYIIYPTTVDYMVFPRMTALSEVLWTAPEKKDYKNFIRRLKNFMLPRYNMWESAYFEKF